MKFFRSTFFSGKVVHAFVQQTTVREFLKLVLIHAFCNDFGAPPQLTHAAIYAIHAALMRMALHALYRTAVRTGMWSRSWRLGLETVSRRNFKRLGLVSVSWKCGKVSVSSRTENQTSRSRLGLAPQDLVYKSTNIHFLYCFPWHLNASSSTRFIRFIKHFPYAWRNCFDVLLI